VADVAGGQAEGGMWLNKRHMHAIPPQPHDNPTWPHTRSLSCCI
jgi:hypothetical protein